MSELNTAAAHPGTGIRGAVSVGDYRSVPAAQAARSVRRLGLRPGLDRQFGGEPDTFGMVVAQEPDPGTDAPRGSLVTLYVSAPSAGTKDPPREPGSSLASSPDEPATDTVAAAGRAASGAPMRRKRRARPRALAPLEHAGTSPVGEQSTTSSSASQRVELHEPSPPAPTGEEQTPAWDELTSAMRDVFTPGAAVVGGRALYPRKPMVVRLAGWWSWLKAHKTIVLVASVAFGLWAASGSMSAHHARARTAQTATSAGAAVRTPRGHDARVGAATPRPQARHTSSLRERRDRPVHTHRDAPGAEQVASAIAQTSSGTAGQQIAAAPPAAAQPTATQTGGGPFSP
jgi:hypothetical protein